MRHHRHPRRHKHKIRINAFMIVFIVYWILFAVLVGVEKFLIEYNIRFASAFVMKLFTVVVALWSGYFVIKTLDSKTHAHSLLGVFAIKLLSGGMLVVSAIGFYFGLTIGLVPLFEFKNTLAYELLSVYFIVFSFMLAIASAYLLFKFEQKSGIRIYLR